jgi:hypothetical protein
MTLLASPSACQFRFPFPVVLVDFPVGRDCGNDQRYRLEIAIYRYENIFGELIMRQLRSLRSTIILASALVSFGLASSPAKAVTIVGSTTNPTGLDGLVIDGATYNVAFLSDVTYAVAYPVGSPPAFFGNQTGASDAADAITAAFNSFGVSPAAFGEALIPYKIENGAEFGYLSSGFPNPTFQSNTYESVNNGGATSQFERYTKFAEIRSGVPESSTWAMMLLGFAGVGFMAYRRRNNVSAA